MHDATKLINRAKDFTLLLSAVSLGAFCCGYMLIWMIYADDVFLNLIARTHPRYRWY